jgi:hypothetical protein
VAELGRFWHLLEKLSTSVVVVKKKLRRLSTVRAMYFTKVKYIEYENERFEGPIPELGALTPLFHKRKAMNMKRNLGSSPLTGYMMNPRDTTIVLPE